MSPQGRPLRSPVCSLARLAANAVPGPASRRPANGAAAESLALLHLPPCVARKTVRAIATLGKRLTIQSLLADPPVFRPLRKRRCACFRRLAAKAVPGPASRRPANGAAAEGSARFICHRQRSHRLPPAAQDSPSLKIEAIPLGFDFGEGALFARVGATLAVKTDIGNTLSNHMGNTLR